MKRLALIDGSAYFYRAFWAVKGLRNSKGLPTNAAYGFASLLMKVLKTYAGDSIVMVFDAHGPTFRDAIYKEYKATREAMPEDLVRQLPYVKALPPAFGMTTLEIAGVEADDVIGTLAVRGAKEGYEVVVITGDKDLMQLVTKEADHPGPGVVLYDEMKERPIGIREVKEKFGVPPERVVDVQALLGDSTDNIPGVKGIGAKTAPDLIAQFGSLEGLYRGLEKVKRESVRRALTEHRDEAFLSRTLASIKTDVPLDVRMDRLMPGAPDRERLVALFTELEFGKFLQELEADRPRQQGLSFDRYRLILEIEDLRRTGDALSKSKRLSVDLETDSADPARARLVGISLCSEPGEASYVPVGHTYLGAPQQIQVEAALKILKPLLEDPKIEKIGQNLKYDALVLRRYGVTLAPIGFDTMVGAYLLNPDDGPFNLETLAKRWLQHDKTPFAAVAGKGTFDQVPVEQARDYSCQDVDVVVRLTPLLESRIREDGMSGILKIELPLIEVLLRMEMNGVRVDLTALERLGRGFQSKMSQILKGVYADAGEEFNLDSPKQLQRILFEKLKLTPGRKTKTGLSTDMAVLEQLAEEHPLPAKVLEYRTLAKLKNTYVDALPRLVNPETGRIHTSYNQAVAATGRLSSSDPNLQNIPVRTPEGREIRRAFVPEPGWTFVSADYSQIELRVVAHVSRDPLLTRAFREGADVHRATAAEVFGTSDVTPELRRRAKEINFGIIYGISGFGLSRRLGIDPRTAQEYINRYLERYAGVKAYIDASLAEARQKGYVTTMFGRRRYVPDIQSKNKMIRGAAERVAINAPIQGAAADLIKIAMLRVVERLDREKLILQVHDELVVEAPEKEADRAIRIVREEMENAHPLEVPLKVDVGRGSNWADLK